MTTGSDQPASDRGREVTRALLDHGRQLGFTARAEVPVRGGRIDVVWFLSDLSLPGAPSPTPVVGFEIESSWRTRKTVKGNYLNLFDLGAAVGVIVLLGTGDDVESLRRFAQVLVDRPGPTVLIWSEEEVEAFLAGGNGRVDEPGSADGLQSAEHTGKYALLWAWLKKQPGESVETTFAEVEEIIGMPLPPSSRKHAVHWRSYQGSAVARAIRDAGWRTQEIDLTNERVTFVRGTD